MIDNLADERHRMRRQLLAQRNAMSLLERVNGSHRIYQRFIALPFFPAKQFFFIYCHYRSEVETTALLDCCLGQGKTVSVPMSQPEQSQMLAVVITDRIQDLVPGYQGIPEPLPSLAPGRILPPISLEVAVIPGAVFDRCGHRLGYGGGYYDRFLAQAAPQAFRVGLSFSCQLVDRIPAMPHDVPMDMVITEHEVLMWSRFFDAKNSGL